MNNELMALPAAETTPDTMRLAKELGKELAESGMYGVTKAEQGTVLALTCILERKTPMELLRTHHLINGKPSMRADAMLAAFRKIGGKITWHIFTDEKAEASFFFEGQEIKNSFTIAQAKQAGVLSNTVWKSYPGAMLRARLISITLRMIAPEIVSGLYSEEETQSFQPFSVSEKVVTDYVAEPVSTETLIEEKLRNLLEEFEPHATTYLFEKGYIKEGETYENLPTYRAQNLIARPAPLLEKLRSLADQASADESEEQLEKGFSFEVQAEVVQ